MKNRVRTMRQQRRLSQVELAELAGVSRQTIHAVETEKYDPSLPLAFESKKFSFPTMRSRVWVGLPPFDVDSAFCCFGGPS